MAEHQDWDVTPGELARAAFEAGKEIGDRMAREECADICSRVWSGPYAEYKDGAQVCEELIRETIK
jgi:hypothetical protein